MTHKTYNTLSAPEQAQLQDRVEELTALLRVRDGENAELKTMVNELRDCSAEILSLIADHLVGVYDFDSFSGQPLALAFLKTPAQSLHDHDPPSALGRD